MKKIISVLAALSLVLACTVCFAETEEEVFAKLPDELSVEVGSVLEFAVNGTEAILNPDGAYTDEELEELTVDLLLYKDCGAFGYIVTDLDGDGNYELMIATQNPDDEFFGKLVLALYTTSADEEGLPVLIPVFESGERDRFYYAGENLFFEEGSSGADDSFATTWAFENGELKDLGVITDPADFVQPELWNAYPIQDQ